MRYEKFCDFEHYCKTCKYRDTLETDDPCNECLSVPAQEGTRVPVNYKDGREKRGGKHACGKKKTV